MKLRNRFYTHPSDDIIVELSEFYSIHKAIIALDAHDVQAVVSDAGNVIVLTGKGSGSNRVSSAIEDAVLHTCSVADGYDIFSANKVIIKIIQSESGQLKIDELDNLSQFFGMFIGLDIFIWGVSERDSQTSDIIVQMIASNLKRNII